jgi:hypothetical protein
MTMTRSRNMESNRHPIRQDHDYKNNCQDTEYAKFFESMARTKVALTLASRQLRSLPVRQTEFKIRRMRELEVFSDCKMRLQGHVTKL